MLQSSPVLISLNNGQRQAVMMSLHPPQSTSTSTYILPPSCKVLRLHYGQVNFILSKSNYLGGDHWWSLTDREDRRRGGLESGGWGAFLQQCCVLFSLVCCRGTSVYLQDPDSQQLPRQASLTPAVSWQR